MLSLSAFFCKRFFIGHRRGHVGAQRFRRHVLPRFIAQYLDPRLSQKVVAVGVLAFLLAGVVRPAVQFDDAALFQFLVEHGKIDVRRQDFTL